MSQHQILGTCPHCGSEISSRDTLIEYERSGRSTQYVECPDCEAVVRPE